MSMHATPISTPRGQSCIPRAVYPPICDNETPEEFIEILRQIYKTQVSSSRRFFYRGILFQKAVVSIAQIANLSASTGAAQEPSVLVTSYTRDKILTDALHNPRILRGTNGRILWRRYEGVVLGEERSECPKAAILIHLEDDPVAVRVFRILGSAVSIAVAIVAQFAF